MKESSKAIEILKEKLKKENQQIQQLDQFDKLVIKLLENLNKGTFWLKDKIFFLKELAYLLKWWVSIVEAIQIIKDSTDNPKIKELCEQIYEYLKKWERFSRIIIRLRKYFNEGDAAVIRAWEDSGELVRVLEYLANQYEFLNETRKKYFWAILYPILLFVISILAIIIILTYVIPNLLSIVADFNADLPLATKLLLMVSSFLENNLVNIIIFLFFLIFGFSIFLTFEEWKRFKDTMIFKLPIFWKLTKYYYLIKFLRYMKLLIYSWMSYVDVFRNLRQIIWNWVYDQMLIDAIEAIRKWESPFKVMENYSLIIPKDTVAILLVWEKTASITESVDSALSLYEIEFNTKINSLSKLLEPVLIVIVGWIVAWIALSVFGIIGSILDSLQQ